MARKGANIYNRPTPQYRRNIAKGEMNKAGVKPPKWRNNPILKKVVLAFAIAWAIASLAMLLINIRYSLLVLLVGVIGAAGVVFYINNEDKKIISKYIKLGLSKEAFNSAMLKRGTNPKQMIRINKLWDKVEKKNTKK